MQLLNVCTRITYDKNGDQKVKWFKAGTMKITDGGRKYMRLFHQPQIEFFIFDADPSQVLPVIDLDKI